jgi:hypothetical protein
MVQEKDPGNHDNFVLLPGLVLPGISDPLVYFPGNPGRCTLISGKSYEKTVQEKD